MNWLLSSLLFLALLPMATATLTHAQQMRIETEVLMGGDSQVVSKSLTLFDDQLIYDFLFVSNDNGQFSLEEVVVFDRLAQSITLLDQARKQKLVITHTDLLSMLAAMKASEALRNKDLFLLEPEFQTQNDAAKNTLTLSSERLTYHCQYEPLEDTKRLISYYHFADWAARLNVSDSRKMPPFARLKMNETLRKQGCIPTQVQLNLTLTSGEEITATAKHHRLDQLSDNDQLRIQQAQNQLRTFTKASLMEYRNLTTAAR